MILPQFLRKSGLTEAIAALEHALQGQTGDESKGSANDAGISRDLLGATMVVRSNLGRMNDLIDTRPPHRDHRSRHEGADVVLPRRRGSHEPHQSRQGQHRP